MRSMVPRWRALGLSARIVIGLFAGLFAGLFLGEPAGLLQPVADIYIRLMQMTVLPYLVTSLIVGFGQLDAADARRLAARGGILLLVIWALTALVIVAVALTFPDLVSASFFSHANVENRETIAFTEIYFTANPFDALSRNLVPAVVLFSTLMGIGLMGLEGKERLLGPLRTANEAVTRITRFVIDLTPIGVFAIGAVAAGTMVPDTLVRLVVYFAAFAVAALLLGCVILPLMVTAVTPFRYGELAEIARDALLTAFVANNAFIVLPILVERSKELLARHGLLDEQSGSAADVMIPVMFNFPNAGKLLTLLFVPYAGWLTGQELTGADFSALLALGIPSYFAKAQIALPFLLDQFHLPHDLFQLYIPTTILTGKFDSMVTAVNLLVFALIGAAWMGGFMVVQTARMLRAAVTILVTVAAATVALGSVLAMTVDTAYRGGEALLRMHEVERNTGTIVHRSLADAEGGGVMPGAPTLAGIRARGTLRIGYDPDNLPMSFFNASDELVGFEIELGEKLAAALGVRAEFVPVAWSDVPRLLGERVIDVMPGVWLRPYWFADLRLSTPYFIATAGIAVRDERRHEFASVTDLRKSKGLVIGVPLAVNQMQVTMERYFGGADVKFEVVEFWKPYFEGRHPEIDGFLLPAEHASAWTLLYPQYTVVVPQPDPVRIPTAFGLARDADELTDLVNEWVIYADNVGIVREGFTYWVEGQGARQSEPRWSILRDVLGWIE